MLNKHVLLYFVFSCNMNNLLNNVCLDVRKKHIKSNYPLNKEHLEILYGLALGDYISRY